MVNPNILELGNKENKQKKITEEQKGRGQFQFKENKSNDEEGPCVLRAITYAEMQKLKQSPLSSNVWVITAWFPSLNFLLSSAFILFPTWIHESSLQHQHYK